jgi:oxalate decarboxylase/phosphoglucose isomerase-like protein (cupin superfamily)
MQRLFVAVLFGAVCLMAADDRIKADNEFVRVIKAEEQVHNKGAMHRHEFNRVMIYLDPGDLDVVYQDGHTDHQHWKRGDVAWSPAGGMHTSENVGHSPFRIVEAEIKKAAPAAAPVRRSKLDPIALDPKHNGLLFENAQVRVFRSWREPGATEKMHEHTGAWRIAVLLTPMDALTKLADGRVLTQHQEEGDVLSSGPVVHAATNTGSQRFEMVVIEVK